MRKQGVPFPESRLLCLLEMLAPQPLLDIERTDIDALHNAIHNQVKRGEIRLAFRYGRTLYDKFSDLFEEEKFALTGKETFELLNGTPQGVFQVADYVSGPFGILKSHSNRSIVPTRFIPLQHCVDHSCKTVHDIALETSYEAPINEHRSKMAQQLERDGASIDPWMNFFDSLRTANRTEGEWRGDAIITLMGDALTDRELKQVVAWLLDRGDTGLRTATNQLGIRQGKSNDMVANLGRAEVLQLACLSDNAYLISALDELVHSGDIVVPEGEIRTAVVNRGTVFGPFHLYAELNQFGVRFQSDSSSIAPLQLRQLIEKMYDLGNEADRHELLWQLRARPGETVDRKLQRHMQSEDPREVVERLALARRSNVVVASEYLPFNEAFPKHDEELVDTMMWKLGFPVDTFPDSNAEIFALHDKIMLALRQNDADPTDEFYEELRGLCANYFVKLEEVLRDSVSFTTWALTTDHFAAPNPYSYRTIADGRTALLSLNAASADDPAERRVIYSDPPTLYAVSRGYERLSVILSDMQAHAENYERQLEQYPRWATSQRLQNFPFKHTIPFLDLAGEAQELILDRLRQASKMLVSADPSELRSGLLHPRLSRTDLDRLRSGIEQIRDSLALLEADGFVRITYTLSSFSGDSMSRQSFVLAHKRGYKYTIHTPSNHSWLRMPSVYDPQYVMPVARIAGGTEVLRFTRRVESPFVEMYEGYPTRPSVSQRDQSFQAKAAKEVGQPNK
ncbi:hypothetical protein AADW15_05730 [Saccharothrix sp. CCNWLY140-2]